VALMPVSVLGVAKQEAQGQHAPEVPGGGSRGRRGQGDLELVQKA